MIQIQRVYNSVLPIDRSRIEQTQEIFRQNFPAIPDYAQKIPDMLDHPFRYGYIAILLVSETALGRVTGFSLVLHFPEINCSLLDFVATTAGTRGGGIGSALFEATRDYLRSQGSRGLYMEVLPDDPEVVIDPQTLEINKKRLAFYEHYGIRPMIHTDFETPLDKDPAPYLLYDDLGRGKPLRRSECRAAVRMILTRKYGRILPAGYLESVIESIIDDPIQFREARYGKNLDSQVLPMEHLKKAFALVSGELHTIHHVKDRGYVERPARVGALEEAVMATGLFNKLAPRHFGEPLLRAVHDGDFIEYLKAVCEKLTEKKPVYPYVFPIRRPDRRPKDLAVRAGYYCIDTFTPLDRNAYHAARQSVDVAVTAAEEILAGRRVVYALCRPPGHHAERRTFGGFCYFNNAAVAAQRLVKEGKVAILDIDYHHGNGAQDIFYQRNDVLTISLHGHPNHSYPYFSGFADETGDGPGKGFNQNYPLPENTEEVLYLQTLEKALHCIVRFKPTVLIVCLGFDTMKGDPTGSFLLSGGSLRKIGRRLGQLKLPSLIVQEGGYSLRNLRRGANAFFGGLAESFSNTFF
ncbi:MAG: histone deacetylase family protein [Sedimentisphaerales bacterium]|nr:histone deacetylase family protein [Sedimentisphaerales bacterium]